jgi:putative membrane protein
MAQPRQIAPAEAPGKPTDHLANERTFLAWVRTAVTVIGLGFVVARFGLLLREVSGNGSSSPSPLSQGLGILLILSGSALVVVAVLRFRTTQSLLRQGRYESRGGLEILLAALLVVVGIVLAVYLLLST